MADGAWKSTAHRRFILTWIYVQDSCKERPRDRQSPQSGPLAPQASSHRVRGPGTSGRAPQGMRLARPFSQAVRALAERLWVVVEGPAVEHAVILFCSWRRTCSPYSSAQRGSYGCGAGPAATELEAKLEHTWTECGPQRGWNHFWGNFGRKGSWMPPLLRLTSPWLLQRMACQNWTWPLL